MYCRGKDTRREIVTSYELHPIAHVQLLEGQAKNSCTGDALTNAYYCFSYKSRTSRDEGTILCGEHAAEDFLHLIGLPRLPLFNPLKVQSGRRGAGGGGAPHCSELRWDPVAKQLHDAIHLLVVCWSTPPGPALGAIKGKLEKFSSSQPFASQIRAINTIVGKDVKKRSLTLMLSDLAKNNSIKPYDFNLLDAALTSEGVVSNFT